MTRPTLVQVISYSISVVLFISLLLRNKDWSVISVDVGYVVMAALISYGLARLIIWLFK